MQDLISVHYLHISGSRVGHYPQQNTCCAETVISVSTGSTTVTLLGELIDALGGLAPVQCNGGDGWSGGGSFNRGGHIGGIGGTMEGNGSDSPMGKGGR